MMGLRYSGPERLAILVEEVGEVAHELTYDSSGDRDKLVKELIQVAAMAASWVEYLEGGHS
jgi:NTP pyrophosphatase (non-canonical NTP hydrolase)